MHNRMGCISIFCILFSAVYSPLCAYSSYVNTLLIVPSLFFQTIRTMPPRRSARNAARGRGRGHGRGNANQQVDNEQVNQGNEEVEGGEEHSVVAAAAPVGGGTNAPVQAMTFTRWMSMRLDTFDGSGTPTDAAN